MSNINKQALREAAMRAPWGNWQAYKPHKGARGYEVKNGVEAVAQHCLKHDADFIAAANPKTVLALLDELEAAEKRIAELEAREVKLPNPPVVKYVSGEFIHCWPAYIVDSAIRAAGIITKVGE